MYRIGIFKVVNLFSANYSLMRQTALVLAAACILSTRTSFSAEREKLTVGAILPLTGSMAYAGQEMQRGFELAIEDARHVEFSVKTEDDRSANRSAALVAVKKLTAVDKAQVIFNAYASSAAVLAPVTQKTKTPLVIIWDSNRALQSFGSHVFGFGYSNELSGEDMAEFARHKLGKKYVAIIGFHDEWSEVVVKSFSERFKSLGGKIAMEEFVPVETFDYRTLISRARNLNADAIFAPLFGSGMAIVIKESRELGFKADILTADGFGNYDLKEAGKSAEGVYVTQVWFDQPTFRRKYEAKFGIKEVSPVNLGYAALAYDCLIMIDTLGALLGERGGKLTGETIQSNLPGFTFTGMHGSTTINADQNTGRREMIFKVENGSFQQVTKP